MHVESWAWKATWVTMMLVEVMVMTDDGDDSDNGDGAGGDDRDD